MKIFNLILLFLFAVLLYSCRSKSNDFIGAWKCCNDDIILKLEKDGTCEVTLKPFLAGTLNYSSDTITHLHCKWQIKDKKNNICFDINIVEHGITVDNDKFGNIGYFQYEPISDCLLVVYYDDLGVFYNLSKCSN